MNLLHQLPKFQEFLEEYGDDLLGFVSLLKGHNYSFSHREISFLSCVKQPGSRVQDGSMQELSAEVALWHFLFRPKSLFIHISSEKKKTRLFINAISLLLEVLKHTKYGWIVEHIEIKKSHISVVGYDSWYILIKSAKDNVASFSGFYEDDLMVWIDEHHNASEAIIDISKSLMVGFTHRLVMA
ncbi:hypothetical protein [Acinetobacter venetianus]|uniref:hypothetical protein n=1 Tax=Acinetobacter venetianus TaxID=52133 RepID=UPI003A947204